MEQGFINNDRKKSVMAAKDKLCLLAFVVQLNM